MNTHNLSIEAVKRLDMVEYLGKLGHSPENIRGNDYWYLSPLRTERTASFKVNKQLNAWYDHGNGEGGNLIDFGIRYFNCSVKDFLQKIKQEDFSFHPRLSTGKEQPAKEQNIAEEKKITIVDVKPISHTALYDYLNERKIPLDVARQYCRQVHYTLYEKEYFAIGFENRSGGFELRNRHFKGSSSPKDFTLIKQEGAAGLNVAEGFFSFLSYQTIYQNNPAPLTVFLVLNSLSFFKNSLELIRSYPHVNLLLDNDPAGNKITAEACRLHPNCSDQRQRFASYKDLNQWHVLMKRGQKQGLRLNS